MKKIATTLAFAVLALALPACGGKSKKRECKPCHKSKVEKQAEQKVEHKAETHTTMMSDKETYQI